MTQPILFTEGELYEVSDAVNRALHAYLDSKDPENHEAVFGSASNLLSATKKIAAVLLGGPPPEWMKEFERRVAELRAAQETSPKARSAVARSISRDPAAERDGIRQFHTDKPKH
jgi:hypothetical protein